MNNISSKTIDRMLWLMLGVYALAIVLFQMFVPD
jgi:hypothetical protein